MENIDRKLLSDEFMSRFISIPVLILIFTIVLPTIAYVTFNHFTKQSMEITVTTLSVFVGIMALIITSHFQIQNSKTTGLIRAFEKLNDPEHRKTRGRIFKKYAESSEQVKIKHEDFLQFEKHSEDLPEQKFPMLNLYEDADDKLKDAVKQVRGDLDEIGSMLSNDLMHKDSFLQVYWGTVIRAWVALYGNTRHMRNNVVSKYFMIYFQELAYEAWKYWKDHHSDKTVNFFIDK